jgi:hypothetical protein
MNRRTYLQAAGAALLLAGCTEQSNRDATDDATASPTADTPASPTADSGDDTERTVGSAFESVRKPEVIDDGDVVADVEWGVEPYVEDAEIDGPLVEVRFTESPGVEADTVRVETAVAGGNAELYNDTDGNFSTTWAGSKVAVEYDPAGDQIAVYAVNDGNATLVHRKHYTP